MKQYYCIEFTTGYFSGNISTKKLQETLNAAASQGWALRSVIHETRRGLLFGKREIHVLVMERDV